MSEVEENPKLEEAENPSLEGAEENPNLEGAEESLSPEGAEESPGLEQAEENPNLEYDADFVALDSAAQPKPERVMGEQVIPAEEPVWPEVLSAAEALMARTQDLRVVLQWTVAALRLQGFTGLAEGLGKLRSMLAEHWDSVHPLLDADDNNDPTLRVNSLAFLGDATRFLIYVRDAVFLTDPQLGPLSLRTLAVANGELPKPEGSEPPSVAQIEAACRDAEAAVFDAALGAVAGSCEQLEAMDAVFSEKIGTAGPDFSGLRSLLDGLRKFLRARQEERVPPAAEADASAADAATSRSGKAAAPRRSGSAGVISGTDDVIRAIEDICKYYALSEPSSPVPILLRRAGRLVGKSFLDIMQDLAPSGMDQIKVFQGESAQAETAPEETSEPSE